MFFLLKILGLRTKSEVQVCLFLNIKTYDENMSPELNRFRQKYNVDIFPQSLFCGLCRCKVIV